MNIFRCLRRKGLVPQTSCSDCLPSFLPKCQPWSSEQGSCPQRWCMILMRSATPTWKKHSARRQWCRWCMVGRLRKRCWIVPPHVTACQSVCVHTATTSVFHVDSGSRCCQNRGKRQDVCRLVQSRPPIQWCEEEALFENFRIVLNLLNPWYCTHLMCCCHIESTAQEASNIPKIIISNRSVEFIFWQCIFTAQHFVWAWKFLVCQNRSVGGVKLTAKCFRSKDMEGREASPSKTPSTHLQ